MHVPGVCRELLSASRPGKGARPAPTSTHTLPHRPVCVCPDSSPSLRLPEHHVTCAPARQPWAAAASPRPWTDSWLLLGGGLQCGPGEPGGQKVCTEPRGDAWRWALAWEGGRGHWGLDPLGTRVQVRGTRYLCCGWGGEASVFITEALGPGPNPACSPPRTGGPPRETHWLLTLFWEQRQRKYGPQAGGRGCAWAPQLPRATASGVPGLFCGLHWPSASEGGRW